MNRKVVSFITCWLAALVSPPPGAHADEFRTPSISAMRVEWRSVLDQLRQEIATRPAIVSSFSFAAQRRVPASDPRTMPALVQLNALTSPLFPGDRKSVV